MSAREQGRRYRAAYDLNHDGRIDMDDLLIALEAPICRHGRR
jgi:hypothetical protein